MSAEPSITLRPLRFDDLELIGRWLCEPHVARWWRTPVGKELATYRSVIEEAHQRTVVLVAVADGVPVGWCQWYRWDEDPDEAAAVGAAEGEVGIDYAIGDPLYAGRGVGTAMIRAVVGEIRRRAGDVGILSVPDAANTASRRVLEKNGFLLADVRPVSTETTDEPMALYRLAPGDS